MYINLDWLILTFFFVLGICFGELRFDKILQGALSDPPTSRHYLPRSRFGKAATTYFSSCHFESSGKQDERKRKRKGSK